MSITAANAQIVNSMKSSVDQNVSEVNSHVSNKNLINKICEIVKSLFEKIASFFSGKSSAYIHFGDSIQKKDLEIKDCQMGMEMGSLKVDIDVAKLHLKQVKRDTTANEIKEDARKSLSDPELQDLKENAENFVKELNKDLKEFDSYIQTLAKRQQSFNKMLLGIDQDLRSSLPTTFQIGHQKILQSQKNFLETLIKETQDLIPELRSERTKMIQNLHEVQSLIPSVELVAGNSDPKVESPIPKPVQHNALQKDPQKKYTWKTISVIGTIAAAIIGGGIYAATRNPIQDTPVEDNPIDFLNQLKLEDANPFYGPICENGLISNCEWTGSTALFDLSPKPFTTYTTSLHEDLVEEVELVDEVFNDALNNGVILEFGPVCKNGLMTCEPNDTESGEDLNNQPSSETTSTLRERNIQQSTGGAAYAFILLPR